MKGRKPKPTEIKKLEGERADRINHDEPEPEIIDFDCPYEQGTYEAIAWNEVVPVLKNMRVFTEADFHAIKLYCESYGMYQGAVSDIKDNGVYITLEGKKGEYIVQNPQVAIRNKTYDQMLKIMTEFGMTAASRTRIKVEKPKEPDEFEKFLNRKKKSRETYATNPEELH